MGGGRESGDAPAQRRGAGHELPAVQLQLHSQLHSPFHSQLQSLLHSQALAVLPGGRTNMTAADVGVRGGSPLRALQRLLAWSASGAEPHEIASRNVIRLDGALEKSPCFGFFLLLCYFFGCCCMFTSFLNACGVVRLTFSFGL